MDPSVMYQQHDWSPQTWAVLLTVMVLLVSVAVMGAFAMMMRVDARSLTPHEAVPEPVDDQAEISRPLVSVS